MNEKKSMFDMPALENELKKTRTISIQTANRFIENAKSYHKQQLLPVTSQYYKESCVLDADTYSIVDDPDVYDRMNVNLADDISIVLAIFKAGCMVKDHFHYLAESVEVLNGKISILVNDIQIFLTNKSLLNIPPKTFHSMKFLEDSAVYVTVPSSLAKAKVA